MLTLPYDITCGYFDCREFAGLALSPRRIVTKFEIEFYLEDGLSTVVDGKCYPILKDHIQIAHPGQERYSRLPFRTMYLKFSAENELAERLSAAPQYFRSSRPERLRRMLEELIALKEGEADALLLQSALLAFLQGVLEDAALPKNCTRAQYDAAEQAKRFMEASYARPIRLAEIAEAAHLSPVYFHNIFSAVCGCTPHDYLIRCRIEQAKKLLWDSSLELAEVAERCGFGCQQYMNKIFRQKVGTSPGRYRKEQQKLYIK